ncbi:MAG: AAA family ATPase [Bacilli bacterium]|nr:AAA family ATPase [Bacilli bacterium]
MFLKNIKMHGFKSFADKIEIELDKKITGIVGPNGSGKSNVVDAVRWVLGEQSVKSLRGDGSMTDVIFSGSSTRNALNVASVTLVFDNSDNYLPLAFSEISIRRRLYKDGTNEYYINNERCRLKDINDLLMDSGFAKESLNIISQGQVDQIILSKSSERRTIIEEAAGVLKYKRRKEESLRKLEKTHANMERVNDVINELEIQIGPLKEQKEKLEIYEKVVSELENLEVSLVASDITNINYQYKEKKKELDVVNEELLKIMTTTTTNEVKIEEFKNNIDKIDKEINEKQKELLDITSLVEKTNSQKNIILERQKYVVEDQKLHDNLVFLKEKKSKITNEIETNRFEIDLKEKELKEVLEEFNKENNDIQKNKQLKSNVESELYKKNRELIYHKNKIDNLRDTIDNNSSLPSSVRNILNNPKLVGIHNVIGKLIEVKEEYSIAIATALGQSANNIVVDNENIAKDAINYLKENNIGRATFFPLNIIKPKGIENNLIDMVKGIEGYLDVASNLVKYDQKYHGIISNQLGNVIIAKDVNSANRISKIINYRYRVVTLDGELFHVGGSITGGKVQNNRNIISDKYELESLIREYSNIELEIKKLEEKINEIDHYLKVHEDKHYLINKNKITIEEYIKNKLNITLDLEDNLNDALLEMKSIDNIMNKSLSEEEEKVINEYYEVVKKRDFISNELNELLRNKNNLNDTLDEFEFVFKKENSLYNSKSNIAKELEIEINRCDVKLDNLLMILNETYNTTYENATLKYKLEIPEKEARSKISRLKKELNEIGVVNLASKDEYDRISTRYNFLITQKEDLYNAENTLLEIIKEMDVIMVKKLTESFSVINKNFQETFKELFRGGNAELLLTDPSNILETGIEIVACPPGKSLKSITLLSGGEKTFTAISLLFAILKSRPVPFSILDEVEAALDESNVSAFCQYLDKFKDQTQFILITHKKKTMEYMDTLYGVTMQESGVSKLVSVKLEEIKE